MCFLNFFKRTQKQKWEILLLLKIIEQLPEEYKILAEPINEGYPTAVMLGLGGERRRVTFVISKIFSDRYFQQEPNNYTISNIDVFDTISNKFLKYTFSVYCGLVTMYQIESDKKFFIDINQINVSKFLRKDFIAKDFNAIKLLLTKEELTLINPSQVYIVELNGVEYYHLKDTYDGDFIGIDIDKNVYHVTHDPPETVKLEKTLFDALSGNYE